VSLSKAETEQALRGKLGFVQDRRPGRDHRVYRLTIDGQVVARTKVSTGTNTRALGDQLVAAMARQLNVPIPLFREIVGCRKGRGEYLDALRERGHL